MNNTANTNVRLPKVQTSLGAIAFNKKLIEDSIPILFLHGVYFDHRLWKHYQNQIDDHTTIAIDMPHHGQSKNIRLKNWNLSDCSQMLIEILDELNIEKCYAIGHSWGSMTILRAASLHPDRFVAVGLCNMPLEPGSLSTRLQFGLQHTLLNARAFYVRQVSKTMFSTQSTKDNPDLIPYLGQSMGVLSNAEIRRTDKAVIMNVDSGYPHLNQLKVRALALKGKDDYVPLPPSLPTQIVEGKHTSPLEQPDEVMSFIRKVIG